jgi:hypothetical protein
MTERSRAASTGPRIPPQKPSWLVIAYALVGSVALVTYVAAGVFGWSFADEDRDVVPASVRQAPGGYRTYHFWHSGYQGGK